MTDPIYSTTPFEGYTHRFIVSFDYKKEGQAVLQKKALNVYSNNGSKNELRERIYNKQQEIFKALSTEYISFNVDFVASKEDDTADSELIDKLFQ
jgi:hypothetical protein